MAAEPEARGRGCWMQDGRKNFTKTERNISMYIITSRTGLRSTGHERYNTESLLSPSPTHCTYRDPITGPTDEARGTCATRFGQAATDEGISHGPSVLAPSPSTQPTSRVHRLGHESRAGLRRAPLALQWSVRRLKRRRSAAPGHEICSCACKSNLILGRGTRNLASSSTRAGRSV